MVWVYLSRSLIYALIAVDCSEGEDNVNLGSIFKRDNPNIRSNENVKVTAKSAESLTKGERLYKLQSEIRDMKPGQTLQGTVVSRNGNTVQVALGQELTISAKLEQSINLTLGQLMSFEIKSNNGSMLSLSPLYTNTANVETIMRALSAAGLQDTAGNIEMVAAMMEEGMPIDKESILNMSRQLLEFPGQNPVSIIQMTRLELPVTEANIEQFEHYMNANHQILGSAEVIMDELPGVFSELMSEGKTQQAIGFYQNVLDIFTTSQEDIVILQEPAGQEPAGQETAVGEMAQQVIEHGTGGQVNDILQDELSNNTGQLGAEAGVQNGNGTNDAVAWETPVLTRQQWNTIGDLMKELGLEESRTEQIKNGEIPPKEILNLIKEFMPKGSTSDVLPHELRHILDSKEFHMLLKSEIERQWLIEPKNVADPDKVERLYERIRQQSSRLHEALQSVDKGDTSAGKSVQNLQNNVDFMNKMNHVFTYIQLPLKLAGNNAHGDLYVYTNKKNLAAKDGNVSALLHLDMEHLGPLDVYVTMQNQKVNTSFTLYDEGAMDLIEQHIGLLDERLAKRGYDLKAQFQMKESEEETDGEGIMQTILNQDKNISVLSRTSFDMRA